MKKEVNRLKVVDSMNDKKLRISKMHFDKMKIDFPFWISKFIYFTSLY